MKKTILSLLVLLTCAIGTVSAQLPSVTLKDINGKAVRTDTFIK